MAPVLRQVYDQMVEPKWVISMGVCASTGGMFNNYAIVQGVDQIVPVDVYVPGCPPGPETLMHGILTLYDQIKSGEIMDYVQSELSATTMLGSGALMVYDEDVDPLLVAWRIAKFFAHESCGKCTPCREGSGWLEKVLYRMCSIRSRRAA